MYSACSDVLPMRPHYHQINIFAFGRINNGIKAFQQILGPFASDLDEYQMRNALTYQASID